MWTLSETGSESVPDEKTEIWVSGIQVRFESRPES